MVREIIRDARLPDYDLEEEPGDIIAIRPIRLADGAGPGAPEPSPDALEAARALKPGADVHALKAQWQHWWSETGRVRLGSVDKAFLGWVRTRP